MLSKSLPLIMVAIFLLLVVSWVILLRHANREEDSPQRTTESVHIPYERPQSLASDFLFMVVTLLLILFICILTRMATLRELATEQILPVTNYPNGRVSLFGKYNHRETDEAIFEVCLLFLLLLLLLLLLLPTVTVPFTHN